MTSTIYTNRYSTLTTAVNADASTKYIEISNPSLNGQVVTLSGGAPFPIQACFTTNLPSNTNPNFYYIYVNGVFQPRASGGNFYTIGGSGCTTGMRMLSFNLYNPIIGSNVIQVVYSNTTANVVSDTKTVIISQPLQITTVSPGNQLIVWASTYGVDYLVLATTNLSQPFEPISGVIPGQGTSTYYNDTANDPPAAQKYYEIEALSSQ